MFSPLSSGGIRRAQAQGRTWDFLIISLNTPVFSFSPLTVSLRFQLSFTSFVYSLHSLFKLTSFSQGRGLANFLFVTPAKFLPHGGLFPCVIYNFQFSFFVRALLPWESCELLPAERARRGCSVLTSRVCVCIDFLAWDPHRTGHASSKSASSGTNFTGPFFVVLEGFLFSSRVLVHSQFHLPAWIWPQAVLSAQAWVWKPQPLAVRVQGWHPSGLLCWLVSSLPT